MKTVLACIVPALAFLLTGCQHSKQSQLEAVAKDWCATIRASQVIPVYPLTEDLEPGDVFLVQSPIAEQRKLYLGKGYLPFENHLGRLNPTNYTAFYRSGYGLSNNTVPPRHWQFPDSSNWTSAPLAGFPTYTFKVKNSVGLNAAFPISGVPVGLGLANASTADGSVTLSETHTYGLDETSLEDSFADWRHNHRALLARHSSRENHPQFIRLITRVYVVRKFDVSLNHDGATSGGLTVGAGKPIDLASAEGAALLSNYTNSISALNKMLEGAAASLPGGSLSVAAASSRSISLKETYARPIVVGYLATEYQLLPGGELGPAYSTRELLEGRSTAKLIRTEQMEASKVAGRIASSISAANADALKNIVAKALDAEVLASGEAAEVRNLSANLKAAKAKLYEYLFDYARGGTPKNTGRLVQLEMSVRNPN